MKNSEKIIDYLWNTLGDDLKLLFIPYKRDMWDSLEGVYNEALKKGWKADILPLPYTFRDETGQFTGWRVDSFDGNLIHEIPKKGEYDAILFHNQYDQCNRVTSVKPEYYTEHFVGLSRALCLIPYGIGLSGELYPGILNADIIFSENEETVNSIVKDAIKAGMNEKQLAFFKQRFVVTGSPKLDIALDKPAPAEWQINGRKVVLFATSLVPLLQNPVRELHKYEELLDNLSSQDQVVIWREHPLTLGTIRAMIPQYEYLYSVIKREFSTRDNVIIDDTDDYRIAFSTADVLYSVPSSLVEVWKQTGKELHIV